jgi:hypothetical protein
MVTVRQNLIRVLNLIGTNVLILFFYIHPNDKSDKKYLTCRQLTDNDFKAEIQFYDAASWPEALSLPDVL